MKDAKTLRDRFLLIESNQVPLEEIPWEDVKLTTIDPTTGKPYRGVVLRGCFADLSNKTPNNNRRYYDERSYLIMIQHLQRQVMSEKGVFGEYEHPKTYNVDGNKISHKILSIWYEPKEKKVYGYVLILDTERGRDALQVIRSGGQLAISARAAGEEHENPDGTFNCAVKLLTTFDLVYHPGFSAAVLNFHCLNESQKERQIESQNKTGFSVMLRQKDLDVVNKHSAEYNALLEGKTFYEYYLDNLMESQKEAEKQTVKGQQETLVDNQASDTDDYQNELKKATYQDLKEQEKNTKKEKYFSQAMESQKQKLKKLDATFYDGSAGFTATQNPYSLGISVNGLTN